MYRNILKTVRSSLYSMSAQIGTIQLENFVQVLPVIKPSQAFPSGKILLCKWKGGDYEGRYTGVIKKFPDISNMACRADALQHFARQILPVEISEYVSDEGIRLQGVLGFDGPPKSVEYVFVASVNISLDLIRTVSFSQDYEYTFKWFNLDQIPYKEMPADDEVWYKHVLEGRKIRGFFNFGGVQERTIKSYELKEVNELETD